jgi:hypothetical protein
MSAPVVVMALDGEDLPEVFGPFDHDEVGAVVRRLVGLGLDPDALIAVELKGVPA